MKENDSTFMDEIVEFYYSTIDDLHPLGNMSLVADKFKVTRAKINKILITAGVIDSPLHQDIMKLKEEGYNVSDIASMLGVSIATVKINMPYEKVIYNSETKSSGASYVENYRKREKIFLSNVVRKKADINKTYKDDIVVLKEEYVESVDDPIHLMPIFDIKEDEKFRIVPHIALLHIELDDDLSIVKELADIKYQRIDGKGYSISRDILVPYNMPLHNLHYVINQAFGFTNSHLHEYTLCDDDLKWITEDKVSKWKKYVGLVFKNPIRDENIDFWDDDYEGGSPKKWMHSKYTGPYTKIYEESYPYGQEQIKNVKIESKTIENLKREFYLNPLAINEALPIEQILSTDGIEGYKNIKEFDRYMKESFEDSKKYPSHSLLSQPYLYSFAQSINYNYDFGDNWNFNIKLMDNATYLVKDNRINASQIREAIKEVCIKARPICIAADGLPLVEDVGGVYGYIEFLKGINGLGSRMYEDKQESIAWAKGNGWPGKIGNLKTLL